MERIRLAASLDQTFLPDGSSWVFALPVGQPVWTGDKMRTFSVAEVGSLVAQTSAAIESFDQIAALSGARPYRFSVLRDHDMRGTSFGTIEEAKFAAVGGKTGAWLRIQWTPEAREDIGASRVRHVSVGIDDFVNQLGQRFSPVALELSLTSYPRIQSLGSIQDTLGIRLSALAFALPGATMDPQAIAEIVANVLSPLIDQLNQRLAAVEAAVSANATQEPPTEPAPSTEPTEPAPANMSTQAPAAQAAPAPAATPAPVAQPASTTPNQEQFAASNLAAFEKLLEDKLKPVADKLAKFESLNLSRLSTPAAQFAQPSQPSPQTTMSNTKLPVAERWAAYDQHIENKNSN